MYVDQPTNEDDPTTYSIFEYTWAFKTWILESFRVTAIRYFDRFNRYRVAAWSKKKGRFLAEMVIPFLKLTPDDNEARSDWWISSKAYFDGFIDQVERVPFNLSRQNMYEISSDIYRQFVEQKIKLERNKKDVDDIKEEMLKFKEEINARPVRQTLCGQHYVGGPCMSISLQMKMIRQRIQSLDILGHSRLGFWSLFELLRFGILIVSIGILELLLGGGLSSFKGHANCSFFNMGTSPNFQTSMRSQPGSSEWQRQMPEQSASHYWQPSPQPGSYYSFGQVSSHIGRPNLQTTIETQHDVDGIVDQRVSKTKNKGKKANLLPLNLGGVLEGYNEEENNVTFLGFQFTGNILFYENVDPAKVRSKNYENVLHFLNNPYQIYLDCYMRGYTVPITFSQELAPHLCMPDMQRLSYGIPIGWLGGEMELMIRRRPLNANWIVAYTSTISVHPEYNQFIILKNPHVIGTLDGSTRPCPSWNDVDWVFLPIHVAGNHWATGRILIFTCLTPCLVRKTTM
uniref:Phospholipase-like protein n=1 Tax=Tanacetum cinerariifolium TaxID=118510 RepID=A0A6L2KKN1_TANCI|nr:hypothetical protein [Tanacetum cinerariifolium]